MKYILNLPIIRVKYSPCSTQRGLVTTDQDGLYIYEFNLFKAGVCSSTVVSNTILDIIQLFNLNPPCALRKERYLISDIPR